MPPTRGSDNRLTHTAHLVLWLSSIFSIQRAPILPLEYQPRLTVFSEAKSNDQLRDPTIVLGDRGLARPNRVIHFDF